MLPHSVSIGTFRHLFLDARYEKQRDGGVVRDAAVLSAIGIDPDGQRRILGVSSDPSEAEVHWRAFLDSLIARGLRGVISVTSDDHAGLGAARKAVLPGALWQRCQFHLAQNAIHHAPSTAIRKRIGAEPRRVWNAPTREAAEEELKRLVACYRDKAERLAAWLESNVPEGLTVFEFPEHTRRRLRTANPIERAIQQEIKRRTASCRPDRDAPPEYAARRRRAHRAPASLAASTPGIARRRRC
jgi:putative transposase